MNKLNTIISILAKIANVKKKDINVNTELFFYHGTTDINTPKSIFLNHTHTANFLRRVEKKYGVFLGNDYVGFNDPKGVAQTINLKLEEAKAKDKADKLKIQDFVFTKHIETIRISSEATMINVIGSGAVSLLPNFWADFDKWYSVNRKKIQKQFKAANKEFKKAAKKTKKANENNQVSEAA